MSKKFYRGYVYSGHVPHTQHKYDTPPPSFMLHGEHKLVALHDYDHPDLDERMVLVVPITSAAAEVKKAEKEDRRILGSYVLLLKTDYEFLEHDSYVSTAQIMPINREWLNSYIDRIATDKLLEIDLQVIENIGLMDLVTKMAHRLYEKQFAQAAGSEHAE